MNVSRYPSKVYQVCGRINISQRSKHQQRHFSDSDFSWSLHCVYQILGIWSWQLKCTPRSRNVMKLQLIAWIPWFVSPNVAAPSPFQWTATISSSSGTMQASSGFMANPGHLLEYRAGLRHLASDITMLIWVAYFKDCKHKQKTLKLPRLRRVPWPVGRSVIF